MKFCRHKYGKWSEAFSPYNRHLLQHQAKECESCGKIIVRRIWWSDNCFAEVINYGLERRRKATL